jgi:anthranilate synthase / indole-3-glycerol phosphate synthase / phosphoribosylanthranilate isomerase
MTAAQCGASMIGLIFAKSKRQVDVQAARHIVTSVRSSLVDSKAQFHTAYAPVDTAELVPDPTGDCKSWFHACTDRLKHVLAQRRCPLFVGVFLDQDVAYMNQVATQVGLDLIQLHGTEGYDITQQLCRPCIRVVHIKSSTNVQQVIDSVQPDKAVAILLDTSVGCESGGTGKTFDWQQGAEIASHFPIMVAGGLKPDNIANAIATIQPWAVDVSSGVELQPRVKNLDLVRAFCANCN